MAGLRGFRFATGSFQGTRAGVVAEARKAESLGYDVFVKPDHLDQIAPFPMPTVVAENTGLRVGTYVLCNDLRQPVVMVQEAATLDVLSGGRLELGLGAGCGALRAACRDGADRPAGFRRRGFQL